MKLLPHPRSLNRRSGFHVLQQNAAIYLDQRLPKPVLLAVGRRIQEGAQQIETELELITGPATHPRLAISATQAIRKLEPEGYTLDVTVKGIKIAYADEGGLRAAAATLRQMFREFGRKLPYVSIRDYPDFPNRGVMLDISRGRVPNLQTLKDLISHLADFKINEFQLYTEHTFAYRNYEPVWEGWGPLNGEEILELDEFCHELGVDLVPNQNSFGHLRYWLEYPPLKKMAETSQPWPDQNGAFLRYPATFSPSYPGTLPFLRSLYDELLPHFSSKKFNVGCDETWDLGRGQSKTICDAKGKGKVYLDFLKQIYKEVSGRGKQMMFWGDIILHYPELIREIPKDVIALNWGYNADHPFERETKIFSDSKLPYYVCPGTSTWMTLIGRHDTAFANLERGAQIGHRNGAIGYLNTDWGDGGHPQPLAVSYLPYLFGASVSWCHKTFDKALLVPVLNRDVFNDPTGNTAKAALGLGMAHLKFNYTAHNVTPFGATVAAPPPKLRELVCRDGLKYYARIPSKNIRAALDEVEEQRAVLYRSQPKTLDGEILTAELDMAARMAIQSCKHMLWQKALAGGRQVEARRLASKSIRELEDLDHDFNHYWSVRNKGTTEKCSPFLQWRIQDYKRGVLHYPPEVAAPERKSTSVD